jgi:CubicO group peptidase (beta-lactamase class C family)
MVVVASILTLSLPREGADAMQALTEGDFSLLDSVAEAELKDTDTPGAAISVVIGDSVILAKGFGVASVETQLPVTPDMLFRLGSTTKVLTALALSSLVEEGKLTLHEPIGTYLKDVGPALTRITAHQLLTHTSGLRDESVMNGPHDEAALGANVRSFGSDKFFAAPGTIYSYANPGYWALGYLVEVVDGRPYADVMTNRVLGSSGDATNDTATDDGHDVSLGSGSRPRWSRCAGGPSAGCGQRS